MKTCTGNDNNHHDGITRQDVYTRVTDRIVADLEQGVRTWVKPWNAEHAAGRITRLLRYNGKPYCDINVLMLLVSAVAGGFATPILMTFKQALELNAMCTKGKGPLVVYANSLTPKERDGGTGDEPRVKSTLTPNAMVGTRHTESKGGKVPAPYQVIPSKQYHL